MKGFINFIREQGVAGLAVGFILGGAVAKMVSAMVTDIINPMIGVLFGGLNLKDNSLTLGSVTFLWGDFVSVLIDFIIVSFVVYFGVKLLKLDRIDKKKE